MGIRPDDAIATIVRKLQREQTDLRPETVEAVQGLIQPAPLPYLARLEPA